MGSQRRMIISVRQTKFFAVKNRSHNQNPISAIEILSPYISAFPLPNSSFLCHPSSAYRTRALFIRSMPHALSLPNSEFRNPSSHLLTFPSSHLLSFPPSPFRFPDFKIPNSAFRLPASPVITPSLRLITVVARESARLLCVAITTVRFHFRFNSAISSMTICPLRLSKLPVGFIGQYNCRLVDQRPGYSRALHFSARKLGRAGV